MKKVYVVKSFPKDHISGIYTTLDKLYADGDLSNQYTKKEVKDRIAANLPVFFSGSMHYISIAPLNMSII